MIHLQVNAHSRVHMSNISINWGEARLQRAEILLPDSTLVARRINSEMCTHLNIVIYFYVVLYALHICVCACLTYMVTVYSMLIKCRYK